MGFGRNPHVAKAEAAELKAQEAEDGGTEVRAWLEAAHLWERAAGKELTLVFHFTDLDEQYTVNVKNAVLHHRVGASDTRDVQLALAWVDLNDVARGKTTFPQMMLSGKLKVVGAVYDIATGKVVMV